MCNQERIIEPTFVSDRELADYPFIVVAKCKKVPASSNHQYQDSTESVVIQGEWYTRLHILSVIKGNIETGEVDMKRELGITWEKDGTDLSSGTSTERLGDVHDVSKPIGPYFPCELRYFFRLEAYCNQPAPKSTAGMVQLVATVAALLLLGRSRRSKTLSTVDELT